MEDRQLYITHTFALYTDNPSERHYKYELYFNSHTKMWKVVEKQDKVEYQELESAIYELLYRINLRQRDNAVKTLFSVYFMGNKTSKLKTFSSISELITFLEEDILMI